MSNASLSMNSCTSDSFICAYLFMASTRKMVSLDLSDLTQIRPLIPIAISKGGDILLNFFKNSFDPEDSLIMVK